MYILRSRQTHILINVFYILLFLFFYVCLSIFQSNNHKIRSGKKKVSYDDPIVVRQHGSEKIFGTYRMLDNSTFKTIIEKEEILDDIDKGNPKPNSENSAKQIFFIETTNPNGGPLQLNPREACAVESAALLHPDRDIYVIFTGPTILIDLKEENESFSMVDIIIKKYNNVYFRSIDINDFSKGSPLEEFVQFEKYKVSKFYSSHLSDVLRYLLLWKYGGLFFDLDVVVLRNFNLLTENFVCKSTNNFLLSGTMHLNGTGIGHIVTEKCLIYLRDHFDGNRWASNGPEVVTAVMKELCNTNVTSNMTDKNCQGIQILPTALFLPFTDNLMYFKERATKVVMTVIEHAYTAHIYNHVSKNIKLTRNSKCGYLEIAKKFCPNVYDSFDIYF